MGHSLTFSVTKPIDYLARCSEETKKREASNVYPLGSGRNYTVILQALTKALGLLQLMVVVATIAGDAVQVLPLD